MKKLLPLICLIMLCSCSTTTNNVIEETKETIITELPAKENPESASMMDSPLNPKNIDNYLFLENVNYVDTRSFNQIISEGSIAGFKNISFYEMIAFYTKQDNILFTMEKKYDEKGNVITLLGEVGSFSPNYQESIQILEELFPKDMQHVFFASAGVESNYLINLLIQYGWNPATLYNCGSFSNGMGSDIAYKDYQDAKYYISGSESYNIQVNVNWGSLTPIE